MIGIPYTERTDTDSNKTHFYIIDSDLYKEMTKGIYSYGKGLINNKKLELPKLSAMNQGASNYIKSAAITNGYIIAPSDKTKDKLDKAYKTKKEELIKVAELCKKHGVTVISDEVHCDLTVGGKKYVPFASVSETAREISITCMSPGKAFNIAGLHTAAVSVPNEILRNKVNRGLNTDEVAEPNAFAIEAAVAAYSGGAEWLDALNGYLDESRKIVLDFIAGEIPEIKVIEKEATYLFWIDVRGLKNAGKGFAKELRLTTGLYLTDGRAYGKVGEGFIRMNIACTKKNLKDGLERLKTGVRLWEDSH